MLSLEMLQPDEGIGALGRMRWTPSKASGVNGLLLFCVVPKWEIKVIWLHSDALSPSRGQKSSHTRIHLRFIRHSVILRMVIIHLKEYI